MSNVSDRIRHYRKKSGMTQMAVSTALGIRVDNYAKYESGVRIPRTDRLIKLAKIFGVSYDALNEGVEREFADLLKSHAIGSVTGEAGSFSAFLPDIKLSGEAYHVLSYFFKRGEHSFVANSPEFYKKYMANPGIAGLIELYEIYSEQCDADITGQAYALLGEPSRILAGLEPIAAIKWAFCIAVDRYLESDGCFIDEVEEIAGSALEHMDALQFFAVKVFVPYLSFLIDAVDLCMNTNIDDFGKAFLFYALTPPEDDDESHDEGEDD